MKWPFLTKKIVIEKDCRTWFDIEKNLTEKEFRQIKRERLNRLVDIIFYEMIYNQCCWLKTYSGIEIKLKGSINKEDMEEILRRLYAKLSLVGETNFFIRREKQKLGRVSLTLLVEDNDCVKRECGLINKSGKYGEATYYYKDF